MSTISSDIDVSNDKKYNFSSFSGTHWKTKGKVAIVELTDYRDVLRLVILPPKSYDKEHPDYTPGVAINRIVTELPEGTLLQIDKLFVESDSEQLARVSVSMKEISTAIVDRNARVYIDRSFLKVNRFQFRGWTNDSDWDGNPELLEKVN